MFRYFFYSIVAYMLNSGLTDEQRAFLWGTVYTSEW